LTLWITLTLPSGDVYKDSAGAGKRTGPKSVKSNCETVIGIAR